MLLSFGLRTGLNARLLGTRRPAIDWLRLLSSDPPKPPRLDRPFIMDGRGRRDLRADPMKGKGPISAKTLAVTAGIFGVLYAAYYYRKTQLDKAKAVQQEIKKHGKAMIGGEFTLTDQHGKVRTNKDFDGKWILLYFGFTHCPDICPEEIEKMCEVVDQLNSPKSKARGAEDIQSLFITVDPKRDGVKEVKEYLSEFSPNLIGLTGTEDQILKVCRTFRVYYSEGPRDQDDDYIVDHTVILYLLNPEGEFVEYFSQTMKAPEIIKATIGLMKSYQMQRALEKAR